MPVSDGNAIMNQSAWRRNDARESDGSGVRPFEPEKTPCRVRPKQDTPNCSSRTAIARPMRPKPAMTAVVPSRSPQCSARAERGHMGPFQKNPRVHARRKPRTVSAMIGP